MTGDLGVISDGELYIVGRIKDLLIVDGRNHYPDDIEATVSEITGGRVAAISIPNSQSEQLVTIAEFKSRGSEAEIQDRLTEVRRKVTAALSKAHGLVSGDLVLVSPGASRSRPAARSAVPAVWRSTNVMGSTDWMLLLGLYDR